MAAAFGKIEAFEEASETWEHYTERLGHYFEANGIGNTEQADKNKRKAILLSVCGSKIYKLMSDLLAPTKPGEKSYDDLVKVVQEQHAPKPSEIVQRFRFNNRFREKNESVSEYVAALRNLAEHCNFENTLEAMIRDRLVCGIANDRIQRRLLSEKELTFKKAYDICHAMEMAAKDVINLTLPKVPPEQVNKIRTQAYPHPRKHTSGTPHQEECHRCGGPHDANDCRFKEAVCFYCNRKGHIQEKCLTKLRDLQTPKYHKPMNRRPQFKGKAHNRNKVYTCTTEENDDSADEYGEVYTMYHMRHSKAPYIATLELNGTKVQMEIDTGASLTVIDETTYKSLNKGKGEVTPKLKPSNAKLKTYTGEIIPILGQCSLTVAHKDFKGELPLIVVKGTSPCLIGRDWLQTIKLNWEQIFSISKEPMEKRCDALDGSLQKYSSIFDGTLGKFEGVKARLYVDENVKPLYFKARPVAYALRSKIEKELDRLTNEGTIEPVEFSEWATPIVPIVKADQSIRICGDYKVTVNQVSKLDNYPIPKTEDLYATLGGGNHFTKLDLSQAYQQLELDDSSKAFTTINTHKGLYQYNRLSYGISSAPGIFQRAMENLLRGIPQVVVRLDDILVTGKDTTSHMENLEEVLSRLQKANVHLKKEKCEFLADEVVYLGHRINSEGIQPIEDKPSQILRHQPM